MSSTDDGLSEHTLKRLRRLEEDDEDIDDVVNRLIDESTETEDYVMPEEEYERIEEGRRRSKKKSKERMKQLEDADL